MLEKKAIIEDEVKVDKIAGYTLKLKTDDVESEMIKEVENDRKEIIKELKIKSYDLMGKIERLNSNVNSYVKEILKDNVDYLKIQIAQNKFREISEKLQKLNKE